MSDINLSTSKMQAEKVAISLINMLVKVVFPGICNVVRIVRHCYNNIFFSHWLALLYERSMIVNSGNKTYMYFKLFYLHSRYLNSL